MALTERQEKCLRPVVYEWDMLVAAAERIRLAQASGDVVLTNLLLEAFVIHFRQLGHFFFARPQPTDLSAAQFLGGRSWKAVTGRRNRWSDLLVRANKQIAHLTAERHFEPGDEQKLEWPVSRLVFEIGEELTEFGNRTGFIGFHALNESDHVLRNQAGPRLTMPVDTVVSATNTPTFCNSIAPGSVVSTED